MAPTEFPPDEPITRTEIKAKQNVLSVSNFLATQGYRLGRTIGEGSYCKVKVGIRMYANGNVLKVACKVINKRKASRDFIMRFLPREISIIKNLHHPNVLHVYDVFESPEYVFIFTNICEKGDLLEYIKRRGALAEQKAKTFFRMLVSAVHYLHALDISHRDLKCENIFITANENLMLGDFGFARSCRDPDTNKRVLSNTFCGSAAYAAPEILQGIPYNPKMYDVWSLGCVLYIMITGSMPFDDAVVHEMLQTQLKRRFEIHRFNLRPSVVKLLYRMLEPDITRRATISQISQCSWFQEPLMPHIYPPAPVSYVPCR